MMQRLMRGGMMRFGDLLHAIGGRILVGSSSALAVVTATAAAAAAVVGGQRFTSSSTASQNHQPSRPLRSSMIVWAQHSAPTVRNDTLDKECDTLTRAVKIGDLPAAVRSYRHIVRLSKTGEVKPDGRIVRTPIPEALKPRALRTLALLLVTSFGPSKSGDRMAPEKMPRHFETQLYTLLLRLENSSVSMKERVKRKAILALDVLEWIRRSAFLLPPRFRFDYTSKDVSTAVVAHALLGRARVIERMLLRDELVPRKRSDCSSKSVSAHQHITLLACVAALKMCGSKMADEILSRRFASVERIDAAQCIISIHEGKIDEALGIIHRLNDSLRIMLSSGTNLHVSLVDDFNMALLSICKQLCITGNLETARDLVDESSCQVYDVVKYEVALGFAKAGMVDQSTAVVSQALLSSESMAGWSGLFLASKEHRRNLIQVAVEGNARARRLKNARFFWFIMRRRGMRLDEHGYRALAVGFIKAGNYGKAERLVQRFQILNRRPVLPRRLATTLSVIRLSQQKNAAPSGDQDVLPEGAIKPDDALALITTLLKPPVAPNAEDRVANIISRTKPTLMMMTTIAAHLFRNGNADAYQSIMKQAAEMFEPDSLHNFLAFTVSVSQSDVSAALAHASDLAGVHAGIAAVELTRRGLVRHAVPLVKNGDGTGVTLVIRELMRRGHLEESWNVLRCWPKPNPYALLRIYSAYAPDRRSDFIADLVHEFGVSSLADGYSAMLRHHVWNRDVDNAEAVFAEAIEREGISFDLSAMTSFASLLESVGEVEKSKAIMAEVLDSFLER